MEKFEPIRSIFEPEAVDSEEAEVTDGETDESGDASTEEAAQAVAEPEEDFEPGWSLVVRSRVAGGERRTVVDRRTAMSPQAENVRTLLDQIGPILDGPFTVLQGEKETDVPFLNELLESLMAVGRKGLDVQRYKGLGEMNPDQLWDTTMDPDTRTLLQVKIDDSVEADGVFTVLMGDSVEPRRNFIERNALSVKNLDV